MIKSGALKSTLLLGAILLLAASVAAEGQSNLTLYFYRDGQPQPVVRPGVLSSDPQADAESLLVALLAGPVPLEQASGLVSPLPAGSELITVTVDGDEVTVDLYLPPVFLRDELDAYRSDAIVEQIVKTLHPLGLHHVHVRVKDEHGELLPISAFLPLRSVPVPTTPPNDDPLPAWLGPVPGPDGQPPTYGRGWSQGALSGRTVWLSAGHGWWWSDTLDSWRTQRPNTYGIVEDFANAEAVNYYLARYLWNAGADVWLVRERAMIEHEVIVDNDDGAPGYIETGSWATSSLAGTGYNNSDYRYAMSGGDPATATWTLDLPEAGWYAVWAWYRHGANRPVDVRYEIHHAGGATTMSISQEIHGQTWRYLGEYYFEPGTDGHVTLLDQSDDPGQAVIADAIRFGGGLGSIAEPDGTSGEPRWEEAAQYWAQYQGAPADVYADDVTARPLYAEWESAKGYPGEAENAVYISWHTNAGGGTGTNSFIHDTEPTTGSIELQDWVHAELIHDLRGAWDPAWMDRGQKSADLGELRGLSAIPGVLLEVAFHDTEEPGDADDLREPLFRQIAARAVFQGIVKYHADRAGLPAYLLPEPPTHLAARNTAPGEVTLTWSPSPCCDGVLGDAATSYQVYHSAGGHAFDNGILTVSPTLILTGLSPSSLHFFRVTALNEGGESFPTPLVAVRTPADGGATDFLVVDGFDRLDETALIPQWESPYLGTARRMFLERMNRYDYAIQHGWALDTCGLAFDGAVNEAVESGAVALTDYPAVDWFAGEDSVADAALSEAERLLLAGYLDGGGRILVSGAEIGYDLVEQARDPAFFQDRLRTAYVGDDAHTYGFVGVAGGPFDGLVGSFDDGTNGTYDVGYPDHLGAAAGSTVVLNYVDGTADGAAVAYAGDSRLIYFGFPLETVSDPATRTGLFCAAADYLLGSENRGVALVPERSSRVPSGATAVYTHTLTNQGGVTDTFRITHASSQGWTVSYSSPITLAGGLATEVEISVAVPQGVPSGTVDVSVLTATSQADSAVFATITDTTEIYQPVPPSVPCRPRLINPGFEGGPGQSAWQVHAPAGMSVLTHRDDLPAYVQPHSGDWLAWLQPNLAASTTLTQVVALPSGEPTATLSLAWFVHGENVSPTITDTLSVGLYDPGGIHQTSLLTVTNRSPVDTWHIAEFDLGAFSGETVQLVLRAATSATDFLVDDTKLVTCGPPGPDEFRALWVDAWHDGIKTPQQVKELVETALAGNLNALVVQVRRRGDTYYPSSLDPWASDADPTFDALAYLIEQAHAAGIEVHAWATTLAIWNATTPPLAPLAANHAFNLHGPDAQGCDYWLMISYAGDEVASSVYYLDPGHPDAADYTAAVYAELAANYALDGLHLDRVRYAWQDWGYNPVAVSRFQAQTGRDDRPQPADEEWLEWRRDQVTALVRKIYLTVTALNPGLRVSAALSAAGGAPRDDLPWETRTPYTHHLQDWPSWLEEGILDLGLPMNYRDEEIYSVDFDRWITWEKDHQSDRGVAVGTGLYKNAVEDSMAQWQRVRQSSAQGNSALGICGYSYAVPSDGGTPRRIFVNAAVTEVFTQGASIPAVSWKAAPSLGHLKGRLSQSTSSSSLTAYPLALDSSGTQAIPCLNLDAYPLTLTGPQTRLLSADGSGWFGAIDLPPGEYQLVVELPNPSVTISQPVSIVPGMVTDQDVILPACAAWYVYLPLLRR